MDYKCAGDHVWGQVWGHLSPLNVVGSLLYHGREFDPSIFCGATLETVGEEALRIIAAVIFPSGGRYMALCRRPSTIFLMFASRPIYQFLESKTWFSLWQKPIKVIS
jgi:hypothetical protein